MNLQRTKSRDFCVVAGRAVILACSLLVAIELHAGPAGKNFFRKTGAAPQNDTQPGTKPASIPAAADDAYTIGPEDVLQISVWHEPEISGPVSVRPDGKISMPLLGDLSVVGLTPSKLQGTVRERLRAFISNPEVAVTVQQVKSRNFNVLGEVQRPGSYPLAHEISVLDAIGVAGGFRDFAKIKKIYVLRRTASGGTERIPFNYKQVIQGINTDQNVGLKPDDTVIVP